MEQKTNQPEFDQKKIKEFLKTKIDKDDAREHINHYRANTDLFNAKSIWLNDVVLEVIRKDEQRNYSGIRVYPALYKKGVPPTDKDPNTPTVILALTVSGITGQQDVEYYNYGQTCPPENCEGDIDFNLS